MADMFGRAIIGQRGRNTGAIQIATTTDGAQIQIPWLMALSLEGLVFSTGFGAANLEDKDPGTFGPGAIAFDETDILVTLPTTAGLQVIPVYWKPVFEAIGTIAAVQIVLYKGASGVPANGLTTATLVCTHGGSSNTTACSLNGLADTGGTAFAPDNLIYREGTTALTGATTNNAPMFGHFSIQNTGVLHVVQGASKQVAGFTGAQAGTGYHHYMQVELPAGSV